MRSGVRDSLVLALLLGCAEEKPTAVFRIDHTGGDAVSADARFRLRLPAGALQEPTTVVVRTEASRSSDGRLLTPAYVIEPKDLRLALPATVEIADFGFEDRALAIAHDGPEAAVVLDGSFHSRTEQLVRASVDALEGRRFVLIDLGSGFDACAGRTCNESCNDCHPLDDSCVRAGWCSAEGACVSSPASACESPALPAGWDAPPGAGSAFVLSSLAIDVESGSAFEIVGRLLNDHLRQSLLGGESLLGLEVAGLEPEGAARQDSITVKAYRLRDADDPFFPANNFKVPVGHDRCCEFLIQSVSLAGAQAAARVGGAVQWQRVFTHRSLELLLQRPFDDEAPFHLPMSSVVLHGLAFDLTPDRSTIERGFATGAVPVRATNAALPPCSSFFECTGLSEDPIWVEWLLVVGGVAIDVDLDQDGLERVEIGDGRVSACYEGDGTRIAAPDPADPRSCLDRLDDGFSIDLRFEGVRATLVGLGE